MRIVWRKRALADIDAMHAWIADRAPESANRVVSRIEQSVNRLVRFPYLARRGAVADERELVVVGLPYVVTYRVDGDVIDVIAVYHTRRDRP